MGDLPSYRHYNVAMFYEWLVRNPQFISRAKYYADNFLNGDRNAKKVLDNWIAARNCLYDTEIPNSNGDSIYDMCKMIQAL